MNRPPDRDASVERLLRQSLQGGGRTASTGACLDAETLAAWADGVLAMDQSVAAEAHVADCSRCQAVLAGLTRATPPRASERWGRRWRLGWLVPLTAAATAVALWFAVPRVERPRSAERTEAQAPDTSVIEKAPGALADRAPAPLVAEPEIRARADEQRQVDKQRESNRSAKAKPPQERETAGERRESSASDSVGPLAEGRTATPFAAPPGAAGAAVRETLQLPRNAAVIGGANAIEILSPDPSIRWRIGTGGSVQYSSNGGSTWETQATGVTADLTAGVSPLRSVCWLVGRAGTVLLSTDGRGWRRLAFPDPVDLIAVTATDARTATVRTSDGRTFRTSDGGLTWDSN